MAIVKRSKKTVMWASFLILLLSTTFVALQITPVATSTVHDVAVTNVELPYNAKVVYPYWPLDPLEIYVTVINNGDYTETFDVTVYISILNILLDPIIVEDLAPGESSISTFNWTFPSIAEKWPYTNYTLIAIAGWDIPVPGDNDPSNDYLYSSVSAWWSGDATGDGHVDEADLNLILYHFGNQSSDPGYDPIVDFNGDGIIDILDVNIYALSYHKGPCDWHDVAVTGIIPVTYPTWNTDSYLTFGVTVQNRGWHQSETFDVTIYNGTDPIDTKTVADLPSRAEELITFTLEGQQSLLGYPNNSSAAWPYPTHTIWAKASTVYGEYDTTDNTYDEVTVTVRWPGDANGDKHVNQPDKDIVTDPDNFGKEFPDQNYNASADFNGDGVVNGTDLEILENITHWHNGPIDYCDLAVTINYVRFNFSEYPWYIWNPLIVYPTWPLEINVNVKNNGNNTETEFTLTAYANTTVMGTKDFNLDIDPGASSSVSFTGIVPIPHGPPPDWPYPYPVYNITVGLTLDCDENLDNNEKTYGVVKVRCPGDINEDGYLDEDDLSALSSAIDDYDWQADFNGNGEIDLDDVQQLISDGRWRKGPRPPDPDPAKKKL